MGIFDKLFGKKDLIHAAEKGDTEIVKMLLSKCTDVNAKDNSGDTALMLAAFEGHIGIVEMLLTKGDNVDDRDKFGATALMYAAYEGYTETVEMTGCRLLGTNLK